jgi:hypothetical protein
MRVVTQDLVVSQNLNFGRNPSCSYVKPVALGPLYILFDPEIKTEQNGESFQQ